MLTPNRSTIHTKPVFSTPPHTLYVYCLKGALPARDAAFGPAFLGNWIEDGFSYLFFNAPAGAVVSEIVRSRQDVSLIDEYQMSYAQWQGGGTQPMRIGEFTVQSSCLLGTPHQADETTSRTIRIDPGVVFGSGLHPTTQDCLKALEMLFQTCRPLSALDLGTGTGILTLAAVSLGCQHVLAVDTHFIAAETARDNIRNNQAHHRALAIQGDAVHFIGCPAELLIANLHYDVIKQMIDADGFLRHKWFVLSGLMRSQMTDIQMRLSGKPVRLLHSWEAQGTWCTMAGEVMKMKGCQHHERSH